MGYIRNRATPDRRRPKARQRLRRLARRSPVTRARHLFMAATVHNFKVLLCSYVQQAILDEERRVLYGEGTEVPCGIIGRHPFKEEKPA